ncbi:MAG: prepilin-type N-terminal cleavage/methylation domain-containing protein [Deltaproteobacteria bacterium]|nr:prepilin-type N-terminal cleavage/methylation domain-containing protein [Deltaproteobacteria bacterium]
MRRTPWTRQGNSKRSAGFTLIEILIVVIVLGILAMIIIPQITVSTEDAKTSTLSTNLSALRSAVELYYHEHDNVYPGVVDDTDGAGAPADAAAAAAAFINQLTRYTEVNGKAVTVKTAAAKYGPYLKGGALPTNSFNDLATVLCDIANDDITVKASSGTAGWKFYTITGVLLANDGAHDSL